MISRYESYCYLCKGRIHVGDEIVRADTDESRWVHVNCDAYVSYASTVVHPVCEVCWLTHAPGQCDRD